MEGTRIQRHIRHAMPNMPTLAELETRVYGLACVMPALRARYPHPESCLEACRIVTNEIQAAAEYDERVGYEIRVLINHVLVDAGLLPAEHRKVEPGRSARTADLRHCID